MGQRLTGVVIAVLFVQIGSTCMMVLEYEISRLKTLHDDLMDKKLRCILTLGQLGKILTGC